jgi:chemosensory pili system protein ChpA (sensor histidine kinase/response regulator)
MSDATARQQGEADATARVDERSRVVLDPGSQGLSVSTIRDLFRVEAHELLAGMNQRLGQLAGQLGDGSGLAEIAARGHALKGSAALAELPFLSRAGAILQRAAELAAEGARRNHAAAQDLVRATRAALGPAQRMLDDCLDGSIESQQRLLDELLSVFDPESRAALEGTVRRDEAHAAAMPEFEELAALPSEEATADEVLEKQLEDDRREEYELASGYDPELAAFLAETFQDELRELLGAVPEMVASLADPAQQMNVCADLGRIFHTVKGSAATVGREDLREVGSLLQHEFEEHADEGALPLQPAFLAGLAQPLETVFLSAGLEPPTAALELALAAARASLVDGEPGAAAGEDAGSGLDPAGVAPLAGAASDDGFAPQIEPEMMEAFTLDADAALSASETALLYLERNPRDRTQLRALFRHFHTLKGAAAAVGLTRIAEQLHAGETLLETVIESPLESSPERLIELLLELVDSVAGLLAQARGVPHEHQILDDVEGRVAEVLASVTEESPADEPVHGAASAAGAAARDDATTPLAAAPTDLDSAIVRVHASRLDLLMNRVSELVVSRTRMEDSMSSIYELKDKLRLGKLQINEAVEGFRGFEFNPAQAQAQDEAGVATASPFEFSDLEFDKYDDFNVLTRTLVELAADAGEIVEQLGDMIDALAEETRQVSKVTSSLQRTITGMRLLSIDTLFRRLQRPIRDAARQTGKQLDVKTFGGEVQVDRALIESLYGPLLHLVRNAVSHGIEAGGDRRAAGKPDVGLIELRAVQRHGSVEVSVRDDGRGLDFVAIRRKGESLGLVEPGEMLSRDELAKLIFRPGFSTQSRVTDLAGRGVGMDVVAGEVEQLRGTVSVESQDGRGATFRIALPLAAMIDQVLLLRAGTQVYALSQGPIETVLNVEPEMLRDGADGLVIRLGEEQLPALSLPALIGGCANHTWLPARAANDEAARQRAAARAAQPLGGTAVVVRTGAAQRMAVLIDRIEAQREAVVRPLGRLFAGHPFLTSATFAGDGQVIFVLDVGRLGGLLGSLAPASVAEARAATGPAEAPTTEGDSAMVLWADDSISVRKLAGHFLEVEGWSARTAVDGRDALEKLRQGSFRVLVTDLEMPRMHGYELINEIRSDPRLRNLPVIVCSSRSSEKHRRRAQEAGANGYLTKPFTQDTLAAALREWLV